MTTSRMPKIRKLNCDGLGKSGATLPIALAEPDEERLVDIDQHDGAGQDAPDVPDATEDDHDQDQDRRRELEEVRGRCAEVGRLERTRHAGEAGPQGEGEELGADRVDAHHLGGGLILADGPPGAADA